MLSISSSKIHEAGWTNPWSTSPQDDRRNRQNTSFLDPWQIKQQNPETEEASTEEENADSNSPGFWQEVWKGMTTPGAFRAGLLNRTDMWGPRFDNWVEKQYAGQQYPYRMRYQGNRWKNLAPLLYHGRKIPRWLGRTR